MNEQQLFVKTVLCGKGILLKKIDIKGRSRMGMICKPKCSVKIVLEEKPLDEFYKLVISGKAPTGIATLMKSVMVQSETNLSGLHQH